MPTKKHRKIQNHNKTNKINNQKKTKKMVKKPGKKTSKKGNINTISFFKKPPDVVIINGYKFLLLPVKKGSLMVTCKVFGGTALENKKNSGISHLLEHVITRAWKKCCKTGCIKYTEKYGTFSNTYHVNEYRLLD